MSDKRKYICCGTVVAIIIIIFGVYNIQKIYNHEKWQSSKIKELDTTIQEQREKIQEQDLSIQELNKCISLINEKLSTENINWNGEGYNYLAIGNSITLHGYADYWWDDDRGMAASTDDKDYVHLVKSYLESNGKNVVMYAKNLSVWETNGKDRAEFLEELDPYLYEGLDLITIQLGENASDLDTWEADFEELIQYIKGKCSGAQIIVVGDFWSNGNRDSDKEIAAKSQCVKYVSLDGIKDNQEYYAGLGTSVEDNVGDVHTIEHSGVADHPGDKGMAAIADRIINEIDLSQN